jgi:pyruvate-ferredoxin/flavodoxin oxidoreductase
MDKAMNRRQVTMDANEAVASIAYRCSEVVAIYPITPASPMGEWADLWAQAHQTNAFGSVPRVVEMQSEAGAAGVVHGSLQAGALTTTFTASQGLLLMIPNMFKIAGELLPTVFHVAARTVATHALSIFGDHSDVMSVRSTGWGMLSASSVQEAQDFALIAHAATLKARIPILHFFDGFRTSHEINTIERLSDDDLRALIDPQEVANHRERGLDPDHPVLRGSAQNPDVFFQSREACNPFHDRLAGTIQETMDHFGERTGRYYRLFRYHGAKDATRVIVLMGSGAGAAIEAIDRWVERGEKVGVLTVHLFRPFDIQACIAALPATTRRIAVLDRTKEPGAVGEPLFQDIVTALADAWPESDPQGPPLVIGGRYGLSSKEFTPSMVSAILRELDQPRPRRRFTVGILDDVTHLSLSVDEDDIREPDHVARAVFFGLGSDGTVGANKNTIKIIGDRTTKHAQAYFVYDSKKSGSVTISHLRFSDHPIRSTYLIRQASFVGCHQFHLLERMDILDLAEPNATLLLNSPYPAHEVWSHLPVEVQKTIIDKKLRFYVINASQIAQNAGVQGRINTVLQTCFFLITGLLPPNEALAAIKGSIAKTYGKRGASIVDKNVACVDAAASGLEEVAVPSTPTGTRSSSTWIPDSAPDFVRRVTATIMAGKGDLLPVSAFAPDGTFPTGTAQYEKRSIAAEIPIWDSNLCIECGLCSLVCPHAAIRVKAYPETKMETLPTSFPSRPWNAQPGHRLTVQVAPDDCTGCGLCVAACPARSKEVVRHKAIDMMPKGDHLERERDRFQHFLELPELNRASIKTDSVKGSQLLQPLFEYSGACGGCGETIYLKLLSQLFGERMVVANATGCSSIYGGNLPTTPWSKTLEGRGPAWANSLFEDNAEFGLGMRLAIDQKERLAHRLLNELAPMLPGLSVRELIDSPQHSEQEIAEQRARVTTLRARLTNVDDPRARILAQLAEVLVRRSVWIIGGDGWAYDIGFGGLDHVLSTNADVNVIVLDTEVYSNTGGQASKSTPRAAIAKFASSGKTVGKKDLAMIAMSYGHVYVAQIAMGANPLQTHRVFLEAESYRGPSLIISYSHCIAHGIDMSTALDHQKDAVATGYWPLFRYDPREAHTGMRPFRLDSHSPKKKFREFALKEGRFAMLAGANPAHADELLAMAQKDIDARWHLYEQMAGIERDVSAPLTEEESP